MPDMSIDNRHKWALPYWARPSIALAKGAGKGGSSRRRDDDEDEDDDDPDDDEDEDDDDPDDDEDETDDLADMDEDELRAELTKVRDQLNRSTSGSAAKRKRIKDLRRQLADAKKPAPKSTPKAGDKGKDDAEPVDVDAIKSVAETEATARANERIVKAEARGALKGVLGVNATKGQVSKLVGMLDLKDIDVDDDGEVDEDALDEAIEALRKDWPQLFPDKGKRTARQRVAGDKDAAGARSASKKKPTATELQVAAALGKPIRR